ncbi:MAG: tetratricopeptide repeat protein [Bacteroidales bacterium]
MSWQNRNISGKKGQQENNSWADTDIIPAPEDSALFGKISDYMKGCDDIEDVKSDPLFEETNDATREMISGFDYNAPLHTDYAKFIRESVSLENEDDKRTDEIDDIKSESRKNDLGKITAEWVRQWDEKKRNGLSPDVHSQKRKEFITNSLEETGSEYERSSDTGNKKLIKKTILARFALPAAAAVAGVFFLVKLLLPSYSTDRLFTRYFEPLSAISPVTRNAVASETNSYASAVESYNNKNYQAAAIGFSDAISQDPLNISPRFFMGITQLALGNYVQAENLLEDVISRQGEYIKEARWYLGLAYVKTGNSDKARECFEVLAKSPGFYSDRAEKILRRLR